MAQIASCRCLNVTFQVAGEVHKEFVVQDGNYSGYLASCVPHSIRIVSWCALV
jgi:hypothetical protein